MSFIALKVNFVQLKSVKTIQVSSHHQSFELGIIIFSFCAHLQLDLPSTP